MLWAGIEITVHSGGRKKSQVSKFQSITPEYGGSVERPKRRVYDKNDEDKRPNNGNSVNK